MLYKNIEIYNIEELIYNQDGSVSWLRIPKNVYDSPEIGEQGRNMARNSTGVELRFVIKGEKVILRLSAEATGRFHIYRGGVQGGWYDHEVDKNIGSEPTDFIIERSQSPKRVKIINDKSGYDWDSEVIRVIFDQGFIRLHDVIGDVEPPASSQCPRKTILCYGSSITHGSNALDMSHSWASLLAHHLNMDVRNLGMAGSCAMEPEFAEYIATEGEKENWNVAILELGINVLDWDEEKILSRAGNMIGATAGRNPDKPVFVISPFYYGGEKLDNDTGGVKWRRLLERIVNELNYSNVKYINGMDILDNISYMSADEVHPNIYGVIKIFEELYSIISESGVQCYDNRK